VANVDQVFERVSEGLSSPISLKVLELTKDERSWAHSLAEVIGGDRLFSVRFLFLAGLVNGLPRRVATVSQAVTTLGFGTVKALALWLPLYTFDSPDPEESEHQPVRLKDLWEHSIASALIAGRMVSAEDHSPIPTAFVAGLLHDVGRVLCYRHFRQEFYSAMRLAGERGISLAEAETIVFGADHAVVGEFWARSMDLPPLIKHTIRYHHSPLASLPRAIDPLLKKTLAVTRIADHFGLGSRLEARDNQHPLEEEWAVFYQNENDCRRMVKRIQQEVADVKEMFGFEAMPVKAEQSPGGRAKAQVIPFPGRNRIRERLGGKLHGKKLTILVVEDHGSLLEVLGLYFMRSGYHVRTAGDGETALEILGKEEVHLLVLDLMLPRLDGFGLLRRLREMKPEQMPYIIVISAPGAEGDRKKILELGADEYVPKPFHLSGLLEKIQAVERQLT
jgi:CheY-like chemotaxis protein